MVKAGARWERGGGEREKMTRGGGKETNEKYLLASQEERSKTSSPIGETPKKGGGVTGPYETNGKERKKHPNCARRGEGKR